MSNKPEGGLLGGRGRFYLGVALTVLALEGTAQTGTDYSTEALLKRIEALEERLRKLENQDQGAGDESPPVVAEWSQSSAVQVSTEDIIPRRGPADELSDAVPGTERMAVTDQPAEPEPSIHVGGALRFNLVHRDFVDASDGKRGESGLDVFRLNIDGELNNILISAEYRFYSYMNTIHHGWLGYEFSDKSQLQVGIHQVPFGLLPYAAHNAWFGVPYYLGLADDYDMGVKYVRNDGPWNTQLAFYKNEELNDATSLDRYSFDLVRSGNQQNEQTNQLNARVAYNVGAGTACETELGGSAQVSEVYNEDTNSRGDHWAAALHLDSRCGRWNFQLQGIRYSYSPANPAGVPDNVVRVGAFGSSYDIAAKGRILTANVAYNFDSPWPQIDQITCYNDYSRLFKDLSGSIDSQINTLGCAIGSGPLFTYIDYIFANNMAFFGNGSMAGGGEDTWRSRFNLNIGYYW